MDVAEALDQGITAPIRVWILRTRLAEFCCREFFVNIPPVTRSEASVRSARLTMVKWCTSGAGILAAMLRAWWALLILTRVSGHRNPEAGELPPSIGVDEKTKEIREATTAIHDKENTLWRRDPARSCDKPVLNEPRFEHHRYWEDREGVWCASDAAFWLELHLYMQDKRAIVLVYDVEKTLGLLNVCPTVSDTIIYDLARDPILRFMYANRQEYRSRSVIMNVDSHRHCSSQSGPSHPEPSLGSEGPDPQTFSGPRTL